MKSPFAKGLGRPQSVMCSPVATPRYIVITPARNEAETIEQTTRSMVAQTMPPLRWVIVDDGSSDGTGDLIDAASRKHDWIRAIHRPDRGFRQPGGGVVQAFYAGYEQVKAEAWEFIVKFDADLSFAPEYFERCLRRFEQDIRLGIGGGTISRAVNGHLVAESPEDPVFHVRGATKIYRRACWDAIGGLHAAPGWDTIDELRANMLGWGTYTFKDIKLLQLKPTGAADGSWQNWVKNGLANYNTGYHPLFMIGKCLKRFVRGPFSLAAPGLLAGFLGGYLRGKPALGDKEFIRYVRRQQINRLLLRESLWTPSTNSRAPVTPVTASA